MCLWFKVHAIDIFCIYFSKTHFRVIKLIFEHYEFNIFKVIIYQNKQRPYVLTYQGIGIDSIYYNHLIIYFDCLQRQTRCNLECTFSFLHNDQKPFSDTIHLFRFFVDVRCTKKERLLSPIIDSINKSNKWLIKQKIPLYYPCCLTLWLDQINVYFPYIIII